VHIEDRLEILENLKAGREAFLEALSDVTEELARRSPGPGKWSVFECVEHVATAEEYLLAQIMSAKLAEIPMINIAREALIMKRGMDRRRRFDAPEDAKPRNRFATLKEALAHFESTREKTIVGTLFTTPNPLLKQEGEYLMCAIQEFPLLFQEGLGVVKRNSSGHS
jgi:hypothetical protein